MVSALLFLEVMSLLARDLSVNLASSPGLLIDSLQLEGCGCLSCRALGFSVPGGPGALPSTHCFLAEAVLYQLG